MGGEEGANPQESDIKPKFKNDLNEALAAAEPAKPVAKSKPQRITGNLQDVFGPEHVATIPVGDKVVHPQTLLDSAVMGNQDRANQMVDESVVHVADLDSEQPQPEIVLTTEDGKLISTQYDQLKDLLDKLGINENMTKDGVHPQSVQIPGFPGEFEFIFEDSDGEKRLSITRHYAGRLNKKVMENIEVSNFGFGRYEHTPQFLSRRKYVYYNEDSQPLPYSHEGNPKKDPKFIIKQADRFIQTLQKVTNTHENR